jgi:leucyl/phenylalanyl-tRNA---protein transferase
MKVVNARLFELSRMPLDERAVRIAELFAGENEESPAVLGRPKRRAARRQALRETPVAALRRRLRVLRHWLAPRRLVETAAVLGHMARDWATGDILPAKAQCGHRPLGFCGRPDSLAPDDLMLAMARGQNLRKFLGVATLWSPTVRAVLRPGDFPRGISGAETAAAEIGLDRSFDEVLGASAQAGRDVWSAPTLDLALGDLFDAGFAHSLEVRDAEGRLIAGLIGVAAGRVFTVERLFARDDEALARGVNALAFQLQRWNFALIAFEANSPLARRLLCASMGRAAFAEELAANAGGGRNGRWRLSDDLRRPAPPAGLFALSA